MKWLSALLNSLSGFRLRPEQQDSARFSASGWVGLGASRRFSPHPTGGGTWGPGRVSLPKYEIELQELSKIFEGYTEEEQAAILAAVAWVIK